MLILLTNDDGAEASGLQALKARFCELGEVVVVAPSEERSGVSHGLTIHVPIRTVELDRNHFALTGTPADCVLFALRRLLPRPPDLVVSGINHGSNLGEDILYSGTVAGAREAALHEVPAAAVSLVNGREVDDFEPAARAASDLILRLYRKGIPAGTYLNLNLPERITSEYRFTRQGSRRFASRIEEKIDPRGRRYYWIGPDQSEWVIEADTDIQAVREGLISVTPLHRDQTDHRVLRELLEGDASNGNPAARMSAGATEAQSSRTLRTGD